MDYISSAYRLTSSVGASSQEIYSIFRRHTDRLFELKRKADEAIDDWGNDLIKQIEDHKLEQRHLVNEALKSQLQQLSETRDQFIATGDVYERNNDSAEIRRLVENCRGLSVKLADINFAPRDTMFINIVCVEPQESINQEEIDLSNARADPSARNSIGSLHERTFDSKPLPSTTDQTNRSRTSSALGRSSSIENKIDIADDAATIYKCPVCLMLFPAEMSDLTRSTHVNEHYRAD